jgi:GT2 family glycosyltransferase
MAARGAAVNASVVIPAWNGEKFLEACLRSLRKHTPGVEIVVVDNASRDNSAKIAKKHADTLIVNERNLGFAGAINIGIKASHGDVILLLNQDTRCQSDWLKPVMRLFAIEARLGIVGCLLRYPDHTLQHAGAQLTEPLWEPYHLPVIDAGARLDFVTGAAMAVRRGVFDAIGVFDEGYQPAYYEDVDFCLRARKQGWLIDMAFDAVFTHYESQSRGELHSFLGNLFAQRLRTIAKHRGDAFLRTLIAQHELPRALWSARDPDWLRTHADAVERAAILTSAYSHAPEPLRAAHAALASAMRARADGDAPRAAYRRAILHLGGPAGDPLGQREGVAHARQLIAAAGDAERAPNPALLRDWLAPILADQSRFDAAVLAQLGAAQPDFDGIAAPASLDRPTPAWSALQRNRWSHVEHEMIRPALRYIDGLNALIAACLRAPDDDRPFGALMTRPYAGDAWHRLLAITPLATRRDLVAGLRRRFTSDALIESTRAMLARQLAISDELALALGVWRLSSTRETGA